MSQDADSLIDLILFPAAITFDLTPVFANRLETGIFSYFGIDPFLVVTGHLVGPFDLISLPNWEVLYQ